MKFFCTTQWFAVFPEEKSRSEWFNREQKFNFFLREKERPLSEQLEREGFINGLAYLADIFVQMNEINLWIQGREASIMMLLAELKLFAAVEEEVGGRQLRKLSNVKRSASILLKYFFFPILEGVLQQDGSESNNALSASLQIFGYSAELFQFEES